jgi:UDP-N-acetylglucosamine 2-epimerase (non-hydrolysing)/GDP/UDP-N,N'-diacetylbacillosamine 2-epimerase (hydrolysing)
MKKRKIAVVTGSRAEYGHLSLLMRYISDDPLLDLKLIVTGSHLSSRFGSTINEIKRDGFHISSKVRIPLYSDREASTAVAMGKAIIGLARAYEHIRPDIIAILGDRFEIHAAASAAVPFRIPVAHIHGGESTEGAIDEQFRHSITKLSHIHFPAAEPYRRRIISMGEDPRRVFCFGAPGLDTIAMSVCMDRKVLSEELNIPANMRIGVVTYHPVTMKGGAAADDIDGILDALHTVRGVYWIITASNPDAGGRSINRKIKRFVKDNPSIAKFRASIGRSGYLSLLKHADVMVGNSSSGLIEAPEFGLPVVNIGDRQRGRVRGINVIDVRECCKSSIAAAVKKALSSKFRNSLKRMKNPYRGANASRKIAGKLKNIALEGLAVKRFSRCRTCSMDRP